MENDSLIVNKSKGRIGFFLLGLFQVGGVLLTALILIAKLINGDFFQKDVWLNFFLIFLLVSIIPAALFALTYAFGDRKIFEITVTGITIKDKSTIHWENIYEIETNKYPGPRMSFYRIKIIQDYLKKQKVNIWFSSDTEPEWTQILDVLSTYTSRHNINLT